MSRLIMWNLLTLDGRFEGRRSWDLEWHEPAWGPELERFSIDQLRTAERLVFGRVTWEGMAAYWRSAEGEVAELMNRLPKVVFSRSLKQADWSSSTLVGGDAAEAVAEMKRRPGGDAFVFGSGALSRSLMDRGLFDEYRLGLVPSVLGYGRRLFDEPSARTPLELLEARPLSPGCLLLRYRPAQASR